MQSFRYPEALRRIIEMGSKCAEYGISDLSRLYNVSLRTLRFYEDKGLLCPSRLGLKRIYTDRDRLRLEIVILARRLGFSLSESLELLETRGDRMAEGSVSVDALGLTQQQISDQIDRLSQERMRVQEAIEELRSTATRLQHGFPHNLSP